MYFHFFSKTLVHLAIDASSSTVVACGKRLNSCWLICVSINICSLKTNLTVCHILTLNDPHVVFKDTDHIFSSRMFSVTPTTHPLRPTPPPPPAPAFLNSIFKWQVEYLKLNYCHFTTLFLTG